MPDERDKPQLDPHQPVEVDPQPDEASRGLLEVDPDEPVEQDEPLKDQGDALAG